MKKRILMTLVTLTLLSSMILCALLGETKAEYFKMLSKKLDFEVMPDLPLEYYLYHAKVDDPKTTTNESLVYAPERGTYKDAENFIQWLRPGHLTSSEVVEKTNENGTGGTNVKSGKEMVYQIKVPVNETGYYTLDFLTYILFGNDKEGASYLSTDFYTISYRYCLGCEVLTQSDNIEFGTNTPLDMPNRVFADDSERKDRSEEKVLYSDSVISNNSAIPKDSVYQWKTLCPYRAENVSLTFKAEQADVDKGYVIWAWDFTGLQAKFEDLILNYTLYVENFSVNKRMELDGTTKYRDSNTPYFMFPQTAYVNNIVDKNGDTDNDKLGAGRNRWSSGRGTYITEATDNSLGMRAELLWGGTNRESDNPVSLYIPLKNVQGGATYKVTFDFSVARQGAKAPDSTKANGVKQADINTPNPSTSITDWHNYNGDFNSIFDNTWSNETGANNRIFQSYLISGDLNTVASLSRNGHRDSQDLITYNNKHYSSYNVTSGSNQYTYGYPLTKYDEVVKYNAKHWDSLTADIDHTTSSNINDTYSIDTQHDGESTYTSTSMRNFFNAVQHTEYNGQYEINWVTFYNTTFSFNIASDANLDELYWVWAIDALRYTAFYNLRIENVRIERVVEFASELDNNGLMIGNNKIGISHMDYYGLGTSGVDDGPFYNYRGWNSTGQNYQARGHATTTYLPKGNIYAPIVDASRFTLTNDFTIKLDGKAVLKGGVDRYVYSIDGGRTWADMEFSGGKASATQLTDAEAGIDLSVKGQSETSGGADMIKFNSGDAYNASFDNFALSVNLVKYKQQANLDIIIAAVPNNHPDYRCEILRIVNFNQIKNYVSFPYDFVSDIEVTNKIYNANGEKTPLNAHRIKDDSSNKGHYYYTLAKAEGTGFTQMKTVRLDTKVPTSTTAYARMGAYSYAYEDVRAAWTGFAVKNTLGFTGWAIVESGIQKYVWSVDGGKTWSDCSGTPKTRNLVNTGYKKMFYDGSEAFGDELKELHDFEDSINGLFGGVHADHGSMLTADLSGHVGEVLDVIFAAKPNNSEVYVPIGRVDNVAVYGDPTLEVGTAGRGMGTFYTKMNEVRIDDQEYQHGISMSLRYDPNDYSNSFARMNWIANASIGIETASLAYLEPYHVNPLNARFFNETVQEVNSGGKIEIEGFTVVEGGVKRYKYSLDGGETWTILYTTQQGKYENMREGTTAEYKFKTQAFDAANACGISLDGDNGNNVSYTHEDNAWLVVNLPALPAGVEKNLLVVAESNIDNGEKNADGTSKGKGFIYPVLHMKIRIKNEGVGYFLNDANGAQAGRYSHGSFSQTFKTGSSAAGTSYKLTFPVSKEGVHTLTFNAALTSTAQNSGTITTSVLHEQTEKGGERYFASLEADKSKGGTVDNVAKMTPDNAFTAQDVDFYFNATAEDVKRGYVVLDWDMSQLASNMSYILNIRDMMFGYGVKATKDLTTDRDGNAEYTIKLPAVKAGLYSFAFSSYTQAYDPVIHYGIDQTGTKVDKNPGLNYKAKGAYMSVAKTMYTVGEPIHVDYFSAGCQSKYTQWIGITRAVNGRDAIIQWIYVANNSTGQVTFRGASTAYESVAQDFAHLPAGDYKIYFRDYSANIYKGSGQNNDNKGNDWPECNITDPISITIVDPDKDPSKNDFDGGMTYYFDKVYYDINKAINGDSSKASGWFSVDKTTFYKGEQIKIEHSFSQAEGNTNSAHVYVGIWKPGADKYEKYSYLNEGVIDTSNLEPGNYQLICCDGGYDYNRKIGSVMGVIDVTILPANSDATTNDYSQLALKYNGNVKDIGAVKGYTYSRNPLSNVVVTEADVERGYVEFTFELSGLVANADVVHTMEMFYERFGYDPNFIYERQGDYLYFGLYPQTLKPENVNIFLKDGPNEQGYYKGNDGYRYAQVVADSSVSGYKFANDSRILSGTTYYFRVEPLKWRIVGESDGDMTVICESIINAMEYGDSNNYEESAVRAWLANEFYNTAFNERQKALIKIVNVDNSDCANTDDKIYLPSYSNVKRYSKAEVLSKTSTDFARVVGSYVDLLGKGNWMLRSPIDSSTLKVSGYDYSGRLYDTNVDDASNGVVPMLKLSYKFDDANTQVGKDVYTVPPPGDKYGVTGGSSYGVSHDNVLTSNFPITKGTSAVNAATYPDASISVDKVYYEYGEDIPIEYRTPSKSGKYRVYITMDEKGSSVRYGTWVVKAYDVNANTHGVVNLSDMRTELHSHVVPNDTQYWNTLPPGEYKIWLYDDRYPEHYGTAYNQYHANSAFITESLSIKILPKGEYNPDFSVTHYSDWEYDGTNYDDPERLNWTSLTLDKTVFKQGEKIYYYIDGSWEHKWVGVFSSDTYAMGCNTVEDYPGKDKTLRYAQWGHKEYINAGSNYLETETLTPGQYKVVYAFGKNLEGAWGHTAFGGDHGNTSQRVMTVIDITILPENCGEQNVTVNYTKADGTAGETVISRPIHFFTPISFDAVLDSVLPESSITFTTSTTGKYRTEKIIRTNVSAINYEDNSNAEVDVDDELYTYIDKEVGDSSTYRFNYSALKNELQDQIENPWIYNADRTQQVSDYYKDSYMKVSKTYFNVGEPINVEYRYNTKLTASSEKAWICIATMGKDNSIKDSYIRWKEVTRSSTSETFDITKAEGKAQNDYAESLRDLPAGEYKIWFIYGPATSNWWDYSQDDDDQNYNNPYINGNAVTEPICIKIVAPDDSDTSLEYKAWIGKDDDKHGKAKYAHIKLEKNVFMQGEPIKVAFNGRTEYMYAWLHKVNEDNTDVELKNTYTDVAKLDGINDLEGVDGKYITEWSDFYPVEKSDTLEPGQYKLYYAVYSNKTIDSVFSSGAIVAIIDITILPKAPEEVQTLKLYAVYTNTAGKQVRRSIDDAIVLNNLLNNNTENYNLTDNDNRVEGIVEFNDVMPNSTIRFYFTYKIGGNVSSDDNIKCTVEEVPCGTYDIKYSTSSNFTIEKPGFRYIPTSGGTAQMKYDGSILSLPGVYYEYGEPIMLSYEYKGKTPETTFQNPRIIITTEMLSEGSQSNAVIPDDNLYVTIPIKYKNLTNSAGTINLNADLVDYGEKSPYLQGDPKAYKGALPVGVYKVWLVDDVGGRILGYEDDGTRVGGDFVENPFKAAASKMITEPITIKVIDPENPNFSIMSNVYSPNNGLNQQEDEEHDNTRIGIDKAIFTQGEKIRFHIQSDYSFRHVMITQGTVSNVTATYEPTKGDWDEANRGITWQYAKYGVTDSGYDTLDTSGLEPGQYKIYYLMGKTLQEAIRGDRFDHPGDPSFKNDDYATYSKLYTIIDIIILPKDASQTFTVTYTKYDGSTATITEQFPMMGTPIGTEPHNGKELTRYHMGVNFTKIINDVMPGTDFKFSTTTNLADVWGDSWNTWRDRTRIDVLKQSAVRVN